MIATKPETLADYEAEDIDDALMQLAVSLGISFETGELDHLNTFGELCDHIISKIQSIPTADSASQLAFSKIRNAFADELGINRTTILPESKLEDFFPVTSRRENIRKVEKHLGFGLHVLEPSLWISIPLGLLFIISLFVLVFHWQFGLMSIFGSLVLITLSNRLGNTLSWNTVGEMAEYLARENYVRARRNNDTFTPNEVKKLIINQFASKLGIDVTALQPETRFR